MLSIKKEFIDLIIAQSKKEFPNEACGILAGKDAKAERVYGMVNVDKSPDTYFMDAGEQLRVMKEIRNLGLEMTGIYHSHVASQAYPSAHDVELAFYPQVSYLILSLKDSTNPSIRSFKIIEEKITEEELKIE